MTQAKPKTVTFEEFVEWKPENGRYELHDGIIVEMQPTGKHEQVGGFLITKLAQEFGRLGLSYFIPRQALIKPPESETGYLPDVLVVNPNHLKSEPLWERNSTLTLGASIPLVVEVVSTNWRDDYFRKFGEYEGIGISEYWIVDYLGIGGKRFTDNPKQPTFSICYLVDGEYQISQFRGDDRIQSPTFPELNLTAAQVFQAIFC
jgi:Uma2 family endonuclease